MNTQIRAATRYAAHRAKRYNKWALVIIVTAFGLLAAKAAWQQDSRLPARFLNPPAQHETAH